MTKEQLIALGAPEELATKIAGESAKELSEIETEKNNAQKSLTERDKQLEELKKTLGDNAELKSQIEKLQETNKNVEESYKKELADLRLNGAIDMALSGAKVKNIKAVKALLNMENIKLKNDGTLDGITSQIDNLKKSDTYLFEDTTIHQKGYIPAKSPDTGEVKSINLADAVKSFFNK